MGPTTDGYVSINVPLFAVSGSWQPPCGNDYAALGTLDGFGSD